MVMTYEDHDADDVDDPLTTVTNRRDSAVMISAKWMILAISSERLTGDGAMVVVAVMMATVILLMLLMMLTLVVVVVVVMMMGAAIMIAR